MLADELDFEESTVQLALNALEQLNMVVTKQGCFTIAGWNEHQSRLGGNMEEQRGQFTFYASFLQAAEELPAAQAGQFLLAVARYGLNGTEPEGIKGAAKALFISVRPTLDNGRKKALAGRRGGEVKPAKETDPTPEEKQPPKTKKPAKDAVMPDMSWATERIRETIDQWLTYKKEKGQGYKATGLKSLLTQIRNKMETHGEAAVIQAVEQSMAANWQGIIWDRIGSPPKASTASNIFDAMRREET